ncbi:hypothetical protein [Micromonospora coerulea]|uniref:hypothetical protein n=1 Tax=Micromonospora coerulea TaxID=47856 RepID=UPI0019088A19|nr:hypothetical protein [Micromonospora veneta]
MSEVGFRTFCHISDYKAAGYANLHRLIAGSKPVVLWAPSSAMFRQYGSISVDDFLHLLKHRQVRIVGRERWLLDRSYRDMRARKWDAAAWDDEIDGAIYRTYIRDLHVPAEEKRVIIAEDEPGQAWAERTLSADPGQIEFWQEVLDRPDVEDYVPGGTLEAITREQMDPETATLRILRDARNHGQAVNDADAEVPFLLSRTDTRFLDILTAGRFGRAGVAADLPVRSASTDALAEQLLGVLARLDECRGHPSLPKFIAGDGHKELIEWLVTYKMMIQHGSTIDDNALMRDLAQKLRQAKRSGFGKEFDGRYARLMTLVGTAGATGATVQLVQEQSPLNILGVACEAIALGGAAAGAYGWVAGSYDGPQWPYLFSNGTKPSRRSRKAMTDLFAAR